MMSSPVYVTRTVTAQLGRNPVPVIKTSPREALMKGPVGPTGGAVACSPGASVGIRDSDRLVVLVILSSPQMATIIDSQRAIPVDNQTLAAASAGSGEWTEGCVPVRAGAYPHPGKDHRGAIVVERVRGFSHDEGARDRIIPSDTAGAWVARPTRVWPSATSARLLLL
jgi:hypothetical protein